MPTESESPLEISSPFMSCISDYRCKMKKLRKKIYKNLKSKHQLTSSYKSNNLDIKKILREDKIP